MPKKAGTIPFQIVNGVIRICLISSKKRKNKFVLPKGSVRSSETSYKAAKRETFEEAGLKGKMIRKGIKIKAKSADPKFKINTIKFFPMYVEKISEKWPEQQFRARLWVDIKKLPKKMMLKRDVDVINSKLINDIIKDYKHKSAA